MSDHTRSSLERLNEIHAAIEVIAEIQRDIDFERVCNIGEPEWWTSRHESSLINATRLLAGQAAKLTEDIQSELKAVRHGR